MATTFGGGASGTAAGGGNASDGDSSGLDDFYEAEELGVSDHEEGRQNSLPPTSSTPSFSQAALAEAASRASNDMVVEDLQELRPRAKTSPSSVPWDESWDEDGPRGRDRCGGIMCTQSRCCCDDPLST